MRKYSIVLALLAILAQTFVDSSGPLWAGTSGDPVASAKAVLETKLLEPLQKKEETRSRYSRAVLPPHARRIRILDKVAVTDSQGRAYLAFAIDESRGFRAAGDKDTSEADWLKDTITGCVYPETGAVLVKRATVYYPASMLLGVRTSPASADACRRG